MHEFQSDGQAYFRDAKANGNDMGDRFGFPATTALSTRRSWVAQARDRRHLVTELLPWGRNRKDFARRLDDLDNWQVSVLIDLSTASRKLVHTVVAGPAEIG